MKTMTCNQLGGACDMKFQANSFDEIAQMSMKHGMEMVQKGDVAHLNAMNAMKETMKSPEEMKSWMDAKRKEFENLPDNNS